MGRVIIRRGVLAAGFQHEESAADVLVVSDSVSESVSPLLGTITDLSATAGVESAVLSWTAAANATSQQPQYSSDGSTWSDFGAALGGSATSVTVTGLTASVLYSFRVIASDGVTQTISNVDTATPTEASAEPDNEPVGFTAIVIRNFDSKASSDGDRGTGNYPNRTGGSEGWDGIEYQYANLTIVDASAWDDSASAMRFTYPVGQAANNGPGLAQTLGLGAPVNLYVKTHIRVGPTYYAGGVSNKLYFHRMQGSPRGEPFLALHRTADPDVFHLAVNFQGTPDNGLGFFMGSTPAALLSRGGDYWIETLMLMESAEGAADGIFRCWVDGVLVIERTNVRYLNPGAVRGWSTLHVSPTYGGDGTPNVTEFYWELGYAYVSGSA